MALELVGRPADVAVQPGISTQVSAQCRLEQLAVIANAQVQQFVGDHVVLEAARLREQVETERYPPAR